jgi:sigma-B regulation protein RsbU (phosphoserine phosphatase)
VTAGVTGTSLKALLVDDDPILLALLTAFMESRGCQVQQAADGRDALDRLAGGGFNLVITDRNMPRMDGLALCRALRAQPSGSYVYCIMLTASDDEASLVAAMEAGVDDFLAKPLRPMELGARLRAAERVLALEAGLAARNRQLAEAYAQLSRDLELARTVQVGQLPAPQDIGGVRFQGLFEASSFVGGDLFDYFAVGGRVAFYLADISGHGVAAAMMAVNAGHHLRAATQKVLAGAAGADDLPALAAAVVAEANARFLEMNESDLYVTLVYGLVEPASGRAALVQAGHPEPLLAVPGAAGFTPLGVRNLPIGILPDAVYEPVAFEFPAGSRLVLYSDGITDCQGAGGAFGEARLRELMALHRDASAAGACAAVDDALRRWRGGSFDDDVALLVVEPR